MMIKSSIERVARNRFGMPIILALAIESLGGQFSVHSVPGSGTRVLARLPLRHRDPAPSTPRATNPP